MCMPMTGLATQALKNKGAGAAFGGLGIQAMKAKKPAALGAATKMLKGIT